MNDEMDIEVSLAWWLEPYMHLLAFFCLITNSDFDEDKYIRTVQRAIRLKPVFR